MGDGANVFVVDDLSTKKQLQGVFLYSHWGGPDLPEIVRRALAKKQRWEDSSYLTRIIFCEMVRGDEKGTGGYGISAIIGDNEHLIIAVQCTNQRIAFCRENTLISKGLEKSAVASWTFEEYVNLSKGELKKAWNSEDE
jgi:hypothetical protein